MITWLASLAAVILSPNSSSILFIISSFFFPSSLNLSNSVWISLVSPDKVAPPTIFSTFLSASCMRRGSFTGFAATSSVRLNHLTPNSPLVPSGAPLFCWAASKYLWWKARISQPILFITSGPKILATVETSLNNFSLTFVFIWFFWLDQLPPFFHFSKSLGSFFFKYVSIFFAYLILSPPAINPKFHKPKT